MRDLRNSDESYLCKLGSKRLGGYGVREELGERGEGGILQAHFAFLASEQSSQPFTVLEKIERDKCRNWFPEVS